MSTGRATVSSDQAHLGAGQGAEAATVLVVDDEPNILELLSAALRLSGFEVRVADCAAARAHRGAAIPSRTSWSST